MMGYVKMCRVAEEIQAGWKPKSGDLYHYNCAINPLRPLVVSPDVHGFRMEWSDEFFKNCFWLPRQEDLQQIFRLKNGNPDDYWILKSFLVWFSDLNFCHYRDVSINKLSSEIYLDGELQGTVDVEHFIEFLNVCMAGVKSLDMLTD